MNIVNVALTSMTGVFAVLAASKYNLPAKWATGFAIASLSSQPVLNALRPVMSADQLQKFESQVMEPALVLDAGSCAERKYSRFPPDQKHALQIEFPRSLNRNRFVPWASVRTTCDLGNHVSRFWKQANVGSPERAFRGVAVGRDRWASKRAPSTRFLSRHSVPPCLQQAVEHGTVILCPSIQTGSPLDLRRTTTPSLSPSIAAEAHRFWIYRLQPDRGA